MPNVDVSGCVLFLFYNFSGFVFPFVKLNKFPPSGRGRKTNGVKKRKEKREKSWNLVRQ
ncbi:hypothetical protein BDV25DRAFT_154417 [Aspergillus avenaceus]|uniref:Uncharacterized protein n=1 Tax=Aspergillus avenaceus TaxID=36643 RepID=A0A5N6TVM6_ASPAV|nr:hypothetical protein BDV25DRAFT_154417 [Aspergillus avenaceus]